MMRSCYVTASAVATMVNLAAAVSAAFVVPGSYTNPMWNPPTAPVMLETSPGSGIFSHYVTGLNNGAIEEFKILEDTDNNPMWGDSEITPNNVRLYGDADGDATITYALGSGVWVDSDGIPLQVVGNFMIAAGGAADWNPSDPAFAMTSRGDGLYTFDATIAAPNTYEFKATDGSGWDHQVGTDGFRRNATTLFFSTTQANENVRFFVDIPGRLLGVVSVPEPSAALLMGFVASAIAATRRVRS
jgi:hypothetical protein